MKHPFETLRSEYTGLMASMVVTNPALINRVATKLAGYVDQGMYAPVSRMTGVPQMWMAASFEREASSNFRLSPAQGDPWNRVSTHVPKGRGPFPSWQAAAVDAYGINGLDDVGAANWTWEHECYYGEAFNGFGYRDAHKVRSPYLWGGTNLQQRGKYVADGRWDGSVTDTQPGIVPLMMRLVQLRPELRLAQPWPFQKIGTVPVLPPLQTGMVSALDVQRALNALGYGPLREDGSYGRITRGAVVRFQRDAGVEVDGVAGPQTKAALEKAIREKKQ